MGLSALFFSCMWTLGPLALATRVELGLVSSGVGDLESLFSVMGVYAGTGHFGRNKVCVSFEKLFCAR